MFHNDAILLYENIFLWEKGLHRRFVYSTGGVDVPITNGSGTGGDGPAITNDLNPTVPKTVGDVLLEPAVIGVAVVVEVEHGVKHISEAAQGGERRMRQLGHAPALNRSHGRLPLASFMGLRQILCRLPGVEHRAGP